MEDASGILKLVFQRSPNGGFSIRAMIPLGLNPADEAEDRSFFRIKDDIVGAQPSYLATVLSVLGQSIVPIVAMVPGEDIVRCIGTGFFVSVSGLLVTAAHVIMDPIEQNYGDVQSVADVGWDMSRLNLGVMVATNPIMQRPGWIFRKIEWAGLLATRTESPLPFGKSELKLTTDTAICKVEEALPELLYQPLAMVQPGIQGIGLGVGKAATAIGYGTMRDASLAPLSNGKMGADFNFDLYLSRGTILERFPDNAIDKQVKTPGPCFSASLKLPGGMSGSPIFDDERIYVHGVVSGGLQGENGPEHFGYGSMLAPSLGLPLKLMGDKSLINLLKEGAHGIPQMRIAGA